MTLNLICPNCGAILDRPAERIVCLSCGRSYPQRLGIPDLRGPGVIGLEVDEIIVEQMLANYDRATYAELLDLRLHGAPTFGDLIGHETAYHLDQAERGREMVSMFQIRLAEFFGTSAQALALDIGCGSGASLVALAESYQHVAGIDPSLPDLILAQKALEARKVANVQLVQAYGQRLPFPDQAFDYVNALNVLEHVFDFDSVLCEIYRVLKPGGGFAADSRNRFDLLLPEPHVKIRWVGWLPRRWAKTYVRWRRGVGYEATQLLSLADLRRGLDRRFGSGYRIVFPHVSAYGGPAWVESWLARLEHMPIMRDLVLWIFPSHLVLAKR